MCQDEPQILGTTNGTIGNRRLFQCHANHGKFVPMSELVKEEEFFAIISGGRERSVSRCSSRSDRAPLYMNTGQAHGGQPTYQNHMFETEWGGAEWRQEPGAWHGHAGDLVYDQWRHSGAQHRHGYHGPRVSTLLFTIPR